MPDFEDMTDKDQGMYLEDTSKPCLERHRGPAGHYAVLGLGRLGDADHRPLGVTKPRNSGAWEGYWNVALP